MTDIISTTSSAIQLIGRLRQVSKNIENAEFANALADLNMEMATVKIQAANLLEENDKLRRRLEQQHSAELTFKGFAYYAANGEGPFCPGCYDNNRKKVRLAKEAKAFHVFGSHNCPVCKQHYGEA